MNRRLAGALAIGLSGALLVVACGDDDDDTTTTDDTETTDDGTTTDDEGAAGETVEVVGVDYAFEGLPDEVESGTTFSFRNDSEDEAHEMVAVLLPDDEERSVEELLELPEEELINDVFGGEPDPAFVFIAGPGQDGQLVHGDATVTEPGRYAVVCFFPVGGDPDEILDPDAEGPPEADGPPHITEGMHGEFTVS